ncbi:MAG TPA: YicC family protein [Bacteroidales bacterium]|nr:YicC family protein [Bacteroidales bacterium]HQO07822.1 YicC family protein [Bacteroidales bacterium]HQP52458.1 YicC family protein [Bacteroidales bacterium]
MIRSMTGYGKAEESISGRKYIAEVKTINSKQFDPLVRLPTNLKHRELDIRSLLAAMLERGKIDFTLSIEGSDRQEEMVLNKPLLKKYYQELVLLENELEIKRENPFGLDSLLQLPNVFELQNDISDEEIWDDLLEIVQKAIADCDTMRIAEGTNLKSDFIARTDMILDLIEQIEPFENERILKIREKLQKEINENVAADKIDQNRMEQEIIFYIEKMDITEEKVRLKNHCDYFLQTLKEDGPVGKKLGFIVQEIGREINTLGAKANDWNIQRIVVLMKDELEKIKEQLFNIL